MKTITINAKLYYFLVSVFVVSLLFSVSSCLTRVKPSDSRFAFTSKLITSEEANIIEQEYINTRWNGKDSRMYNYKIEELEGYINYVKTETKRRKIKDVSIRVYMAAYPKSGYTKMDDPNYAGYQTIFFAPVASETSGKSNGEKNGDGAEEDLIAISDMFYMNMGSMRPPGKIGTGTGN